MAWILNFFLSGIFQNKLYSDIFQNFPTRRGCQGLSSYITFKAKEVKTVLTSKRIDTNIAPIGTSIIIITQADRTYISDN